MTTYFGDTPIKQMSLTRSWGINPSTAEMVCVGTLTPALKEEMWLTIGGTTWFGRVKGYQTRTSAAGVVTNLKLIDNRDKLMETVYFGQFNMRDEDGLWYHLFPGNSWTYQERFYPGIWIDGELVGQSQPLPPATILSFLLSGIGFTYQAMSESIQSMLDSTLSPCRELDWNLGKKHGLALLEICDNLGLNFAIGEDPNVILLGRKGTKVEFLSGNFKEYAEGLEQILTDDRVTVIGDPNLYEITDAPLTQDWPAAWDHVIQGPLPLMKVLRDLNPSDPLSVTVGQMPGAYRDEEQHAGYPRNEMLARDYADAIPYRVYKLDLDTSISLNNHTSDFSDLMPIYERLVSDPDVLVKVQSTGYLHDPQNPNQPARMVTDSKSGGYTVDRVNGKVIFNERKFKGDFLVQVGDQYKIDFSLAVPDTPLLTFAVQREIFTRTWGTGSRRGTHQVRNLRKEYIYTVGGTRTATIDRGLIPADQYARYVAGLITSRPTSAASGFIQRQGQCGYELDERFDRITVTLDGVSGISENVAYATEQPQLGIPTEREMERRAKAAAPETDLSKANEVWDAVNAAVSGAKSVSAESQSFGGGEGEVTPPEDLPIMDPKGCVLLNNGVDTFEFGDVICGDGIDETTGKGNVKDPVSVVDDDPSFAGVVVQDCTDADQDVRVKSTGLATVKVNGVVAVGDSLGPVAGQVYAEAGKSGIGIAKSTNADEPGYVRVQQGAGGGGSTVTAEFHQVDTPTPVEGKTNRWYKSGVGGDSAYAVDHHFVYSFGESEWIDQFGWA